MTLNTPYLPNSNEHLSFCMQTFLSSFRNLMNYLKYNVLMKKR